jgi:glycine C-acetyltransferase
LEPQKGTKGTGTMSANMKKTFSREMLNLDAAGLLRAEIAVVQSDNMQAQFSESKCSLNFVGNDVLGWSSNDRVREAAKEAFSNYGTGSTSSRGSIGTLEIFKVLEERLASFFGLDDCILFPSTYLANVGLFEPLTNKKDRIFIDEMSNPGLFDGTRLSSARVVPYQTRDDENLEYHLKCSQNSRFRIVVTDGVFHTSGDCANLARIQELKNTYDAITIVDDSFGVGVLGENGRGTFSHLQLETKPDLLTASFAYALGNVSGGFVSGDQDLIEWIRHTSRPYILSEPMSPMSAAIVLKAIEILEDDQSVLERLYSNSKYAKEEMLQRDWELIDNDSPFVSINVGSTLNAQKMVEYLFERDILISGLCYPNTPEGASLLRINLSASHTKEQIDSLVGSLEQAFGLLDKG